MKTSTIVCLTVLGFLIAALVSVLVALFCIRRDVLFDVGRISPNRTEQASFLAVTGTFTAPVTVRNSNFFALDLTGSLIGELKGCVDVPLLHGKIPHVNVPARGQDTFTLSGTFEYQPSNDKSLCVAKSFGETCAKKDGAVEFQVLADVHHRTWAGTGSERVVKELRFDCAWLIA